MQEPIWEYVAFCLLFLQPAIQLLTLLLDVLIHPAGGGGVRSPYAFIFGVSESHFLCQGLALALLLAAPLFLLLPALVGLFANVWALLIGAALFVATGALVTGLAAPVLHYTKTGSLFQFLEDRFQSKYYALRLGCVYIGTVSSLFDR